MLIGIYGIIFEFYNPGIAFPGVVGAISLLLALYAFQVLPVNYAGLALIGLGLALMVGEMLVPSFGALGIGGIVAFVVGSIMLMDTDAAGLRHLLAGGRRRGADRGLAAAAADVRCSRAASSAPVVTGQEEMIGSRGRVRRLARPARAASASMARSGAARGPAGLAPGQQGRGDSDRGPHARGRRLTAEVTA